MLCSFCICNIFSHAHVPFRVLSIFHFIYFIYLRRRENITFKPTAVWCWIVLAIYISKICENIRTKFFNFIRRKVKNAHFTILEIITSAKGLREDDTKTLFRDCRHRIVCRNTRSLAFANFSSRITTRLTLYTWPRFNSIDQARTDMVEGNVLLTPRLNSSRWSNCHASSN